jgi:hypothetical protein
VVGYLFKLALKKFKNQNDENRQNLAKDIDEAQCKFRKQNRPHRLILIRHGESLANTDHNVYATMPDNKIPLTEKGRLQATYIGKRLKEII